MGIKFINHQINRIKTSVLKRGVIGTFDTLLSRYFLKFRFRQLDLWGRVEPPDMSGPEHVKDHATRYEATHPLHFIKLFDGINWDFEKSVFVDFGCGKGASLVYASERNFRKIIGIEFCEELSKIANRNLSKHLSGIPNPPDFEIINIDAALYEIPKETDCFYFFNPFDSYIFELVMKNIGKSMQLHPRKILILYMNAVHSGLIMKYPFRQLKYLPPSEVDLFFPGGAAVFLYDPAERMINQEIEIKKAVLITGVAE